MPRPGRGDPPQGAVVIRLVGAVLAGTHDEWLVDDRRCLSEASMAKPARPRYGTVTAIEGSDRGHRITQSPLPAALHRHMDCQPAAAMTQ